MNLQAENVWVYWVSYAHSDWLIAFKFEMFVAMFVFLFEFPDSLL